MIITLFKLLPYSSERSSRSRLLLIILIPLIVEVEVEREIEVDIEPGFLAELESKGETWVGACSWVHCIAVVCQATAPG